MRYAWSSSHAGVYVNKHAAKYSEKMNSQALASQWWEWPHNMVPLFFSEIFSRNSYLAIVVILPRKANLQSPFPVYGRWLTCYLEYRKHWIASKDLVLSSCAASFPWMIQYGPSRRYPRSQMPTLSSRNTPSH